MSPDPPTITTGRAEAWKADYQTRVDAHRGRIWADSAPGRGTELRFRLPRVGLELAGT